jgi:hypothetical protein
MTQGHTTAATVQEAQWTAPLQHALMQKALAPVEPLVDAASSDAE